jgi:hypothetical protein
MGTACYVCESALTEQCAFPFDPIRSLTLKKDRKTEDQGHRHPCAGHFVHILSTVFKFTQLSPSQGTGFTDTLPNMGIFNTSGLKQNLEVGSIYFVV